MSRESRIVAAYTETDLSIHEIAMEFGISDRQVNRIIAKHGKADRLNQDPTAASLETVRKWRRKAKRGNTDAKRKLEIWTTSRAA